MKFCSNHLYLKSIIISGKKGLLLGFLKQKATRKVSRCFEITEKLRFLSELWLTITMLLVLEDTLRRFFSREKLPYTYVRLDFDLRNYLVYDSALTLSNFILNG